MRTILGLDLGVASIGWAIIGEDGVKQELLNSGVRIIPIDSETVSNFSKGISSSKSADRRQKRTARRNIQRFKLRRHFLVEFLKENNLWPLPESLFRISATELYGLRDKAIRSKIELAELARIWLHLNQKRGYFDSRKRVSEDEKDTKYVEAIKDRSRHLYDNYKTAGSYFYHKLLEDPLYRVKSGNDKENIFLSDDYKLEFDLIWETQKIHYPEILTDVNYDRVRTRIIYYKRKLKSQKHLIGKCRFEKNHKCTPISSPIAEEIRLWQDVNKLVITNKYNEVFLPTKEQKQELFRFLMENESISAKAVLERLQFPYSKSEGYKPNFEKQLKGYGFRVKLLRLLEEQNVDTTLFTQFDALGPDFSNDRFYQLWHLLYSVEDNKELKKVLVEKWKFGEDLAGKLMDLPIKNDFTALSSRAARKLLPGLRQGMIYSDACKAAGYNHSESITREENENRTLAGIKDLEQIKPNTLRNPTVEKILNQLINLLKSLNSEGYTFDEIRVELARELKKNAKERQKISDRNREHESYNEQCRKELLEERGITRISKRDLEKYKLWKEFGGCSPYEPNKVIEISQLFDKALYEIEHIIPKSRLFDDSFNNRTIARVHVNKEKDNRTAFDYMNSKSEDDFHQYSSCIKHNQKIHPIKRNYLMMPGDAIPEDFINRQLNETRYITSETLKLLKQVCRHVHSTSGTVTDYLKHYWGYDEILMDLNFDRVLPEEIEMKEVNGKQKKVIKEWTKRLDNRHHALDAIVIACTKQSYIQQLNELNQKFNVQKEFKETPIKNRVPFSYETVKSSLANILVSYKPGKKVATLKMVKKDRWEKEPGNLGQKTLVPRGALHEDSIYGHNRRYEVIAIGKLDHIEKCAVPWQKELIAEHLKKYNGNLRNTLKNLKKDPVLTADGETLTDITIYVNLPVKRYDLEYSPANKFDERAAKSIVNDNVKRLVLQRLTEFGNDPARAFKNLKEDPLYFNKEKGIVINSVRCYVKDEETEKPYPALHESAAGHTLNHKVASGVKDKKPVNFVIEGNNHHISIFTDGNNDRHSIATTFFEAFQKKTLGTDVITTVHPEGHKFSFSIQRNEMFVFNMNREELQEAIAKNQYSTFSKHLYRVLNIAPKQFLFLHHLESKIPNKTLEKQRARELKKLIQCSASSVSDLKVRITRTGKIELL